MGLHIFVSLIRSCLRQSASLIKRCSSPIGSTFSWGALLFYRWGAHFYQRGAPFLGFAAVLQERCSVFMGVCIFVSMRLSTFGLESPPPPNHHKITTTSSDVVRRLSIRLIIYLDDMILLNQSRESHRDSPAYGFSSSWDLWSTGTSRIRWPNSAWYIWDSEYIQ